MKILSQLLLSVELLPHSKANNLIFVVVVMSAGASLSVHV
jgi:hypothetical protein